MSSFQDDKDACSIISWGILEKERDREKNPYNPVIKLSEQEYSILVELSELMGYGVHWRSTHEPVATVSSWDALPVGSCMMILLPLCYTWLGHLRLGLLKVGGVSTGPLYTSLVSSVSSVQSYHHFRRLNSIALRKAYASSDPYSFMLKKLCPLHFLVLKHLSKGEFEVCVTLRTDIARAFAVYRTAEDDASNNSLKEHLAALNHGTSFINISPPAIDVTIQMNNRKTNLVLLKPLSDAIKQLEKDLLSSESDKKRDKQKKEFISEVEKCFGVFHNRMQQSGVVFDGSRMEDLIFLQHERQSTAAALTTGQPYSSWVLNPLIAEDIGDFMMKAIFGEGEKLLNEQLY